MPFDISRLLNESPELADRALDAGSEAMDIVGERFDNASRTLRYHPGILIAGGLLVGFAAAGVYLGARHWRARELERLRTEQRTLELALEREEQQLDLDDEFPVVDEPLMADGRPPEEIEQQRRMPNAVDDLAAADPGNPLTDGPVSQGGSVIEAEFADRNTGIDDMSAGGLAEDLVTDSGRR